MNQHPVNREITLLAAPGGSDRRLETPGDCMIVRADAPGSLSLVAASDDPNAALDAEVRLERIVAAAPQLPKPGRARAAKPPKRAARNVPQDVSILAHVSRRGDVTVPLGEWICGPDLPLPIEGLEIRWSRRPRSVGLDCTVVCARGGQRRIAAVGEFAGTRGKAAPLLGLELSLTGTVDLELKAEALFLGSAIVSQRGRKLSFAGPSGREPLVGLRLEIVSVADARASNSNASASSQRKQPRKVRVYRSAPPSKGPGAFINHNLNAASERGI